MVTACNGQNSYSRGANSPSRIIGPGILAKARDGIVGAVVGMTGATGLDFFWCFCRLGELYSSPDTGTMGSRSAFPCAVEGVSKGGSDRANVKAFMPVPEMTEN